MEMFLLMCDVLPVPDHAGTEKFRSGKAVVWVWTDSIERAETMAENWLFHWGWMIEKVISVAPTSVEEAKQFHFGQVHYWKAQKHGVAADITGPPA